MGVMGDRIEFIEERRNTRYTDSRALKKKASINSAYDAESVQR